MSREYRKRNAPGICGEYISYLRGCRCLECKKANARYCRENRIKRGKEYIRNSNLKHSHGLSLQEYNSLLKQQDGVCAVCKKLETGRNQFGTLPLAVDHDHHTNKNRGLLCMRCNRALGLLGDSSERILSLFKYREQY